mmetsp:Transcript_131035/g.231579  ORF Transcript_131035/g.231579 Transcript_131035/m.231579 type:complete len:236 (-) Transcript_131035:72-779(-)
MGILSQLSAEWDHLHATDWLCSTPVSGALGVAAYTGCSVFRGRRPRLSDHDAMVGSAAHGAQISKTAAKAAWHSHSAERSQAEGFLSVPSPGIATAFPRAIDIPDEDELEGALDANAEEANGEVSVAEAIEQAQAAAEDAHSAAEVAIISELVAAFGTLGAIISAWIGYKMDDSMLPEEAQVPEGDAGLPPELLRPPPPDLQLSAAGARRGTLPRRSTPAGPGSAPVQLGPSAQS